MNHRNKTRRKHDYSISVNKSILAGILIVLAIVLVILVIALVSEF